MMTNSSHLGSDELVGYIIQFNVKKEALKIIFFHGRVS